MYLRPLLFTCYVNDIAHNISSSVCQHADDTLVYRPVHDETAVTTLQCDLNTVLKWAQEWQISLNPRKTEFLRNIITYHHHNYHLQNTQIPLVIDHDLSIWESLSTKI